MPEATQLGSQCSGGGARSSPCSSQAVLFISPPVLGASSGKEVYSGGALDCAGGDQLPLLSCTQSRFKAKGGLQAPLFARTLRTSLDHQSFGAQGVSQESDILTHSKAC